MKIRYKLNEFLYSGFICLVILMNMLEATSLKNFDDTLLHNLLLLSALGFALFYIIESKYTIKKLLRMLLLNGIGILCFISSGNTGLFMTILAICLLPPNFLDNILNIMLKEETIIFALIVALSMVGVLKNGGIDVNKGTYVANARSLGFGHPNMLAAQGASIVLLFLCVNRKKLKRRHIVGAIVCIFILYFFSRGRTSLLLSLFAVFMIICRKKQNFTKVLFKVLPWMYIIVLISLTGFMFTYAYLGENATIVKIINDSIFNGRIGLAYRSLLVYPVTLFGKKIDLSYWNEYQYYSLDNGQVMILLEYGVIGFLAYFVLIQKTLKTLCKEKEIILAITMIIFLIWSMYEGTMYFIGKNFALLFIGTSDILTSKINRKGVRK